MSTKTQVDPHLLAVAAELPRHEYTTEELIEAGRGHLSDGLAEMFRGLGIEKRHSVLSNYPDVLFHGAEPKLDVRTTELAVKAVRKCLAKADVPLESIGLVLGVTSSPGRLLPSLVCEVMAQMPELPRTAATLSIEFMGCSAMAKVVDTARWFLNFRPDQNVLVCFVEAVTPLSPELPDLYRHFSEPGCDRQSTVDALHGFLFADAAVAMVLGAHGPGPSFGPVANLTNELASDAELGTVPDGGSDVPVVQSGRRMFTLSPDVTARGAYYAKQALRRVLGSDECVVDDYQDASVLLLHTGSTRILDGLCAQFGVRPDDAIVASSYNLLRDYGNTIGCSVPLMLAEPVHRQEGQGLIVSFGLSFSCGAFTFDVPAGGWHPDHGSGE